MCVYSLNNQILLEMYLTNYFTKSISVRDSNKISCLVNNENKKGKKHGDSEMSHDSGVMVQKLIKFSVHKNRY